MSQPRSRPTWEARIQRARDLAAKYSFASQILLFYSEVAGFQQSVHESLSTGSFSSQQSGTLSDTMDSSRLLPHVPELLSLVSRAAPAPLSDVAQELQSRQPSYWQHLLAACSNGHQPDVPETHVFFARTLLQPYAEKIAEHAEPPRSGNAICPVCGGNPVAAVLREEAHGAKRSLVCSLCITEWDYKRVICPACGEEEFDKLPTYRADQFQHLLVEACDTCEKYITAVDLTKDGHAIPEVDELAALPLNLWANENGYTKLQPNLLGM